MNPIKASTTVICDKEEVKKEKRYYYIVKSIFCLTVFKEYETSKLKDLISNAYSTIVSKQSDLDYSTWDSAQKTK